MPMNFRLGLNRFGGKVVVGVTTITNTSIPTMTGVPREGETAWFGSGDWSATPNFFRFKLFLDAVQIFSTAQAGDALSYDWVTADVGKVITGTVEGSTDGGTTYSSPVAMALAFPFLSDVVTPATIAAPVLTRTSATGVLPATFTVAHSAVYSSYLWEWQTLDSLNNVIYDGTKGVSENELVTPFTPDWSGATDPVPAPGSPPALTATQKVQFRLRSADYAENSDGTALLGVVSPWAATMAVTDPVPHRAYGLRIQRSSPGDYIDIFEVEGYSVAGGTNQFLGKTAYGSAYYNPPSAVVDGNIATDYFSMATPNGTTDPPVMIWIDFGATTGNWKAISQIIIKANNTRAPRKFDIVYTDADPSSLPLGTVLSSYDVNSYSAQTFAC